MLREHGEATCNHSDPRVRAAWGRANGRVRHRDAGAPPLSDGEPPSIDILAKYYDLVHGSADVPYELRAAFVPRTQQIGVVEIVGALIPYLSAPRLLGSRNVIHWIDNHVGKGEGCRGGQRGAEVER
eukprot:7384217-Prymnesium_polylepis.1